MSRERDLEACRAANAARYAGLAAEGLSRAGHRRFRVAGTGPYSPAAVYVYRHGSEGLRVTLAVPRRPYAIPTGKQARYAHLASHGFLVWRDGAVVLADWRYLCGGNSTRAALEAEPGAYPVCPKCTITEVGYEEAVERLTPSGTRP